MADDMSNGESLEWGQDTKPKTDNNLIGRLSDSLSNSYKNVQSNLGRTYDNFSQGNVLHGLADTAMLYHDPNGSWGQTATDKANHVTHGSGGNSPSIPEPTFGPNHLTPVDENGHQALNDEGQSFLNAHAAMIMAQNDGIPQSNANATQAPQLPSIQAGSFSKAVGNQLGQSVGSYLADFI